MKKWKEAEIVSLKITEKEYWMNDKNYRWMDNNWHDNGNHNGHNKHKGNDDNICDQFS